MVFDDGTVSSFNWAGEVSKEDIIDAGLYDSARYEWLRRPVDVRFGNAVTSIGNEAFTECTSLKSITIPASMKSIGDTTFDFCTNLTSISILEGITAIGGAAFGRCINLKNIIMPASVVSIGPDVFFDVGLTSLVFKGKTLAEV